VPTDAAQPVQTAFESSDDSDEENFDWEDVEIGGDAADEVQIQPGESLTIVIGDQDGKPRARRKAQKTPTQAERKLRLDVHKIHMTCLLYHVFLRNHWCNDHQLQVGKMRTRVGRLTLLEYAEGVLPGAYKSAWDAQYRRQPDGSLQVAEAGPRVSLQCVVPRLFHGEAWSAAFILVEQERIGKFGAASKLLIRLRATQDAMPRKTESFTGLSDFREKARKLEGSPDYGAQLFCAWLRSLGVDTRLVCSIQPLPFTFAASLREIDESVDAMDTSEAVPEPGDIPADPVNPGECRPIVRFGQPNRRGPSTHRLGTPTMVATLPTRRPRHPVFWVEVFDPHLQRWMPVDCITSNKVDRSTVFEPAMNDPANQMAYVFAFEESGYAKDVTRRYTKAFVAKTRKIRVERSDRGAKWLKKAMRMFRRTRPLVSLPWMSVASLIATGSRSSGECRLVAAGTVRGAAKEH
jgi:xeroderma pigmentosum group C-complementing protein